MNKSVFIFMIIYTVTIVSLWAWWMQPNSVYFTGYDTAAGYDQYEQLWEDSQDE